MSTQTLENQPKNNALTKYTNIIIYIVILLVFIAGLLIFNIYMSAQIAKDTTAINLASRQSILVQQMAKDVMNIDLITDDIINSTHKSMVANVSTLAPINENELQQAINKNLATSDSIQGTLDSLRIARDLFNETLSAFADGGQTKSLTDNIIQIEQVKDKDGILSINNSQEIWAPYMRLMDSFLTSLDSNELNKEAIGFTVDYARTFNGQLLYETNDLVKALEVQANKKTKTLQTVQTVGIGVSILFFFLIIFGALRRLLKTDAELAEAREQTAEILATVNEGLFLIDKNLVIANEYSDELETIIGQKNLGGKTLTELLEKIVPAKDLEDTKTFIDQLYSDWVVEDLITDLNPLKRLKVQETENSSFGNERYLDFGFSRVYHNDDIVRILVNVVDITQAVLLEKRLENEKAQNDRQMEMLGTIINTEPVLLNNFIQTTMVRIEKVNNILKTPGSGLENLRAKAREIYREIHSLKGESSALKLTSFVTLCQTIESKVKNLTEKADLTGSDFLGMAVNLDELLTLTLFIDNLAERIGYTSKDKSTLPNFSNHEPQSTHRSNETLLTTHHDNEYDDNIIINEPQQVDNHGILATYFSNFAHDIANRHGKEIDFRSTGIDDVKLSPEQQNTIKDITIQLIRNAIVHGIETPDERILHKKQSVGRIQITLGKQGNIVSLVVIDDGYGINYDKIRRKAIDMGHSIDEVQSWTHRELLNLLFTSGFSTADSLSEDAGRGVGLDIIKSLANDLGGTLKVASKPNQYTKFSINFPAKAN